LLINFTGTFLSARHVIVAGEVDVRDHSGFLGLCPRNESGNVASRILHRDLAIEPWDVCIGQVNFNCETPLTLKDVQVNVCRDVAAYGYPITAQNVSADQFWMYGRGFKGYIHREVKSHHFPDATHPDSFETSFAMPHGLSGSPLIVHDQHCEIVVGVCAGANRGETIDFMLEEVNDKGEIFREKTVRVEEYGIAHDIRPLFGWKPSGFSGPTLLELGADAHRDASRV
jgi:hypothetical protein